MRAKMPVFHLTNKNVRTRETGIKSPSLGLLTLSLRLNNSPRRTMMRQMMLLRLTTLSLTLNWLALPTPTPLQLLMTRLQRLIMIKVISKRVDIFHVKISFQIHYFRYYR
jgi:hypothetical protein